VTRSSQSAAPAGSTASGTEKKYVTTVSAMTAVIAPALCRRIVPAASARTAVRASSAAVPATRRTPVSALIGNT